MRCDTDEADSARAQALLWAAPTGEPVPAPPIDTRLQVLPIGQLHWQDAERLFLRLLHTIRPVQYAKLFGMPGQAQGGIDAYARLLVNVTHGTTEGRDRISLQSRNIKSLTPGKLRKAVDQFLGGEWAARSEAFYFATSYDLQEGKLDAVIREQTDRLAELGITFVPWGLQEVSALLKNQPRLVDDFFGRAWVHRFCGTDAAQALTDNLNHHDVQDLRTKLRHFYQAVFHAQGETHFTRDTDTAQRFVVLDVAPERQQPTPHDTDTPIGVTEDHPFDPRPPDSQTYSAPRIGARRQSFRAARHLLKTTRTLPPAAAGIAADDFLAGGKCRLLIGRPGSGKSSLLRFIAMDLLSLQPQSIALQREHGLHLPIWLPFGFLCRHLQASESNSLVSAAESWLKSQSATDLWPLVKRAFDDDRLLLLVDGIDEWSNVGAAEEALGIVEGFLGRHQAAAILSTRPYAVERLNWQLPWVKAEIAPLTDDQRRAIALSALAPKGQFPLAPNDLPTWGADIEGFLDQVSATPELAELSRSPLFLTLLAATWRGGPLPSQRFKIYLGLIDLLIEKHPRMRQRASRADGGPLTAAEATTLFAAVAYRLRVTDATGSISTSGMRKLIVDSMTDDEVLGYERPAARRIADAVLTMAEQEFGLIVSHGAGTVGFVHRVLLDHLAGQYLATLPADEQAQMVSQFVDDPGWRDVLLALLSAQVSSHTTEQLLAAAMDKSQQPWTDINGCELLAEALAAGVKLTPRSQSAYLAVLVQRVETHPSIRHRANLIAALVGTLGNTMARNELLPIMKRWFTAPRQDPSPILWTLRDLDINDEAAAGYLMWGLRHFHDTVKINAAKAFGHRFGGRPEFVDHLVTLIEAGPSSETQAAALLGLGHGWPTSLTTAKYIDWARRQPSVPLRLAAFHVLRSRAASAEDKAEFRLNEHEWLLQILRKEGYGRGSWPVVGAVGEAAAVDEEACSFVLNVLRRNGRNGGDRWLAWNLACTVFADDVDIRCWVTERLANPDDNGLILHNLAMIPRQWHTDPMFAQAYGHYVDGKLQKQSSEVAWLAAAMPPDGAKAALLRCLDGWYSHESARILADQHLTDPHVRSNLTERLRGAYSQAAPLAGIAIDVLGAAEGFAVLKSLLYQPKRWLGAEHQILVAQAVARAWQRFEMAATSEAADAAIAQQILIDHDASEVAQACAITDTYLVDHVPAVVTAWPEHPAVQDLAEAIIYAPHTTSAGGADTIPAAIAQAYCGRADEDSCRIFTKTVDLLTHLEPELREVLAFELSRGPVAAGDLISVTGNWRIEPDIEVRRNAFIGLVQSVKRHQDACASIAGSPRFTDEMEWLRQQIRADLFKYRPNAGHDIEELRRLAWIGMLMLGDLSLCDMPEEAPDGLARPSHVRLGVGLGDFDDILVDLVADNWQHLSELFGEGVFERLVSTIDPHPKTAEQKRRHVLSALAGVAHRYPAIAELLRTEADQDPLLRHELRFLHWAKVENNGDEGVLRALIRKLDGQFLRPREQLLDSLLDRDSWNVSDNVFKAILSEPVGADQHMLGPSESLCLHAQLFPTDALSVAAVKDLETWFTPDNTIKSAREWREVLAVAFGAAYALDLPAIVVRANTRLRMGIILDSDLPDFAKPLVRRLRTDVKAVDAFRTALSDPMGIRETSPILAERWDPIADESPELEPARRIYLFGCVLREAGALRQQEAQSASAILASIPPNTVVHNPFTNHSGPIQLGGFDLVPG